MQMNDGFKDLHSQVNEELHIKVFFKSKIIKKTHFTLNNPK